MRRVLVVAIVAIALVSCGADNAASSTAEGKKYVDAYDELPERESQGRPDRA